MNRILIRNGYVVGVDPAIGNVDGADVLVEGSRIAAVGRGLQAGDAETIEATGMIVMPGFVDTHRHLWQGAMRGVTADWSLLNYLGGIRMSAADCYGPDDMYAAQYQGALEAINAGVTTVADYCHNLNTPEHAEEAIRGVQDSLLRCVWSYGYNGPPTEARLTLDERYELGRRLALRHFASRDSLVTLAVAPEELPLWQSPQAATRQFELARELDVRVFWHCNCVNGHQDPPQEAMQLQRMGLLNERVVLVHMNYTTPEEWQTVAASGASVSCTPETELQMGMGMPATVPARERSIVTTFGADIASNNSGDLFTALRLGLQVAREQLNRRHDGGFYDGVPIRCDEALSWGTLAGAQALGLAAEIGSLTPGKQADIVLLNTDSIRLVGWNRSNPAATIIQQATVADVDTVLIGGRVLKRHGRLVAGEQRACTLLAAAAERIAARVESRGGFYVDPQRTFELMARSRS
jgi:cytosine/adenosine deaminase-related metal-dependent hydrolase